MPVVTTRRFGSSLAPMPFATREQPPKALAESDEKWHDLSLSVSLDR